jgi:hypothetical protein
MIEEKPTEGDTEALEALSDIAEEIREETADLPSKPKPARDPITGHFLPGNCGGGRPKGSKDKVSQKLVNLMTDLMDRRGEELLERIADNNPSDALAILTRIIPQAELQRIYSEGITEDNQQLRDISIRLVSDNTKALPHDDTPKLEGTTD